VFSHSRDGAGPHPAQEQRDRQADGGQPQPYCGVITEKTLDATAPLMLECYQHRLAFQGRKDREKELYMYLDEPLQKYLDELASAQPTPGGGSAAALSGALGAGLACMVARLTLGKADYAAVQQEITALVERTEDLRARFQQLMQEDIAAYGRLSATFKLPRAISEEKAERTRAIQEQLVEAALVPLEVAERAVELVQCCLRIATIGNANVLSDIATGTELASSAANGAAWMVRTNLRAMKDQERVQALSKCLSAALESIAADSQQVIDTVGARV
jgi:formiminotetrahydrofolate cyclodeaminase